MHYFWRFFLIGAFFLFPGHAFPIDFCENPVRKNHFLLLQQGVLSAAETKAFKRLLFQGLRPSGKKIAKSLDKKIRKGKPVWKLYLTGSEQIQKYLFSLRQLYGIGAGPGPFQRFDLHDEEGMDLPQMISALFLSMQVRGTDFLSDIEVPHHFRGLIALNVSGQSPSVELAILGEDLP